MKKGGDEDGRAGTETAMSLAKGKETFWCFGTKRKTLFSRGNSKLCVLDAKGPRALSGLEFLPG